MSELQLVGLILISVIETSEIKEAADYIDVLKL
jgi:hypothetical protein